LQTPGKEFTRTCKGLVVVLIGGYVLLQLLPSSLNYLAIIPSKYVPLPTTLKRDSFSRQSGGGSPGHSFDLCLRLAGQSPMYGLSSLLVTSSKSSQG